MPNYKGRQRKIIPRLPFKPILPPRNHPAYMRNYMKIYRFAESNPSDKQWQQFLKRLGIPRR